MQEKNYLGEDSSHRLYESPKMLICNVEFSELLTSSDAGGTAPDFPWETNFDENEVSNISSNWNSSNI